MDTIIGKCGFCCSSCPAYKANIKSEEDKIAAAKGWSNYHGLRVEPEYICCEGCASEGLQPSKMDTHCRIRPCATSKGYETCAECNHYLCHDLKEKAEKYEDILLRFNAMIPTKDYLRFVKPYEGKINLDRIRARLSPSGH